MDVTHIIESLNDAQREAVTAPSQSMLVLAGAGSGKTRVLVHRIAWMIKVQDLSPQSILAVTFTNKAATEMRGRIETLLDYSAQGMWVGTFHGLAHRLLRRHAHEASLPEAFQVLDSDDQLRMIKRLLKAMGLDEARWPPRQVQGFINGQKEEGRRADHILEGGDLYQRQMLTLYREYERSCMRSGLVDFAELLLRAHELLRDNEQLLQFYKQQFLHVHVDEFQDTNTIQYAWLRLLTEGKDNLFVVGDDDQSIYGWRGAKVENIYSFQSDYPNHQVVRLEQNYRSTANILNAANALIVNNQGRMGKELWTDDGDGEPISLYAAFNEQDEAYFVVERIKKWVELGGLRSEIAILYRSNVQSRLFEERLMSGGIPYRVYGGLRFFERAEIKNALAYLHLITNATNDSAFERVINIPNRGIGPKTIEDLRRVARDEQVSLWQAANQLVVSGVITARTERVLRSFIDVINNLAEHAEGLALFEKVQIVVEQTGLIDFHKKEKGEKGEARVENLQELVNAARQFDYEEDNAEGLNELDLFLAHAALESGETQGDQYDDCVQLMTLHSAKGLEFKLVFIVGIEEGLFPSPRSIEDPARLEEERRLCYVGITRAMQILYLSYAESRRIYGRDTYTKCSRFNKEIPSNKIQEIRMGATISRPVSQTKSGYSLGQKKMSFELGQRVSHVKFGEGIVLQVEGEGAQERVQVNFTSVGMKWLMLAYAKLEAIG